MSVRRNNRKWLWWGAGILVVALIITAVTVAIINANGGGNTLDSQQDKTEVDTAKKIESSTDEQKGEPAARKEEVKQYDGDNPNEFEKLTGVISYSGINGDSVIIRLNIDQYLTNGDCKMIILKDGVTVYNSVVQIESSVSTSTCAGFSVPRSELPGGDLMIEVVLESEGKYGKIVGGLQL